MRGNSRSRQAKAARGATPALCAVNCARNCPCLNGWGRRPPEAGKRARHFSGELVCTERAAPAFGRHEPPASPPSSPNGVLKREAQRKRPAPRDERRFSHQGGVFSQCPSARGSGIGVSFGNAINGILSRFPSRFSSAAKTDSNHDPTDDRQKPPNTPPMTRAAQPSGERFAALAVNSESGEKRWRWTVAFPS